MKLTDYRGKRDPSRTNEPFGPEPAPASGATTSGAFVIHLHDATRRHYDLRLEVGGVLSSFAVPKGPSLDPAQKRLAIRTEDHPIEYLDFEAVVPEGNYGAGPMILWDRGRVRYHGSTAEEGIARGKLEMELWGLKVRGRFELIRMKGRGEEKAPSSGEKGSSDEWLLFKKSDAWADRTRDIVAEQPRSVLSGLTVLELAEAPGIARALEAAAREMGAAEGDFDARRMVPMPCAASGAPERDEGFLYELKLDGMRLVASKRGADVTLTNRKLRSETARYPEVARAVKALAADRVVLDGEVVAFDEAGKPSFQRLSQRMHLARTRDIRRGMVDVPVVFLVFDVLALGGLDLRGLPLARRKELLARLLPGRGVLRVLDHIEGDGTSLLAFCREHRLEGVVAKRARSTYKPGPQRGTDWVKMKCERDEELVIVGWTQGEGARSRMGALDLATFVGDRLVYRGKVGSGLDDRAIDQLLALLEPLRTDEPAVRGELAPAPRGRTFVRPEVVASVRFIGWSDEGHVRHPVFRGVREDVYPRDCTAAPLAEREEAAIEAEPAVEDAGWAGAAGTGAGDADRAAEGAGARGEEAVRGDGAAEGTTPGERRRMRPRATRVVLTNPDKVFWPEDGYTKRDLFAYYEAIAPAMLPHLRDRPVVVVRYPDGIRGSSFFQWNAPLGMPDWLRRVALVKDDDGKTAECLLVDDVDGLVYMANMACIPIHVLACRAGTRDQCDFLTIDFDVKNATLADAVAQALSLRELLEAIGLRGFPKTSGQSGLHVLVALGPGQGFATARTLAELLGRLLVERHPDTATMERIVSRRGAKVYVDTGQTGTSRTIVAPYSVRATPGATVSTPLDWGELGPRLDPAAFDIRTVVHRWEERGDPMEDLLQERPDIQAAVERLAELLAKGRR